MGDLVVISNVVPYPGVPHAGGRYLHALVEFADQHTRASGAQFTLISPNTPAAREGARQPGSPANVLLLGAERANSPWGKLRNRREAAAHAEGRRTDPGFGHLPMERALQRPGPGRAAVEAAEVVDLQWAECIRAAPIVRKLNPETRLVGTFHDVQSQLFARMVPEAVGADRAFWELAVAESRKWEQSAMKLLDRVVVFSDKDAELLANGKDDHKLTVIPPPLATGSELTRRAPAPGSRMLFVANFSRDENRRAVRWAISEIWPRVHAALPHAEFRLVGAGMPPALADEAVAAGASVGGYVEDLSVEYAAARAVLVPLTQGAGVKFKTIEAMLAGIPVVTTTVGAEGIGGPHLFARVSDDAPALAATLYEVLTSPADHFTRAKQAQTWAIQRYGKESFQQAVVDTWLAEVDQLVGKHRR